MISISFYANEDYEELVSILKEAGLFDEVWEGRSNLMRKIERDPESILVAIADEKIVGCIFIMEDGWNAFVWRLAVKEEYRNKGIGSMLLEKVEHIVQSRGIKEISLFVDANNDDLKEWYKKHNYSLTRDFSFMFKKL